MREASKFGSYCFQELGGWNASFLLGIASGVHVWDGTSGKECYFQIPNHLWFKLKAIIATNT